MGDDGKIYVDDVALQAYHEDSKKLIDSKINNAVSPLNDLTEKISNEKLGSIYDTDDAGKVFVINQEGHARLLGGVRFDYNAQKSALIISFDNKAEEV